MRLLISVLAVLALPAMAFGEEAESVSDRDDAVERVDSFILRLLESDYAPPGFAIAIVDRNGPVLVRGYGVTNSDTGQPVTEETAFYNASVTKQFTALAAVRLEAQGLIDLEASLADLLPDANLPRRLRRDSVSLRALLTHSSRMGNSSLNFVTAYIRRLSADEVVQQIDDYSTFTSDEFRYGNHGYIIFDAVLQRVLGYDWREAVREQVLQPSGMSGTFSESPGEQGREIAYGHEPGHEGWEVVSPKPDDLLHAAGGLFTTAADMAKWLEIQLNDGRLAGAQLIPVEDIRTSHRPVINQSRTFGPLERHHYAMGWNVGELDGETILEHGGGYRGVRAWNTFMPDHGLGVAVLTNSGVGGHAFSLAVIQQTYDELLGRPDAASEAERRLAQIHPLVAESWEETITIREQRLRVGAWDVTDSDRAIVAGRYRNERLGNLVVRVNDDGALSGTLGAMRLAFRPGSEEGVWIADPGPGLESFIAPWTVRFNRQGDVTGFDWEHRRFERID